MKRRLFIALNLDPRTRAAIGKIEKNIEDAFGREWDGQVRFMPEENWHITVSFLGTQDDAALTGIVRAMHATAEKFSSIDLAFAGIAYAPREDNPRMIWLRTSDSTSRAINDIKNSLEPSLDEAGVRFERESRMFSGHITLARFLASAPRGELPHVERKLNISCTGESLDLMESELDRTGAAYTVLQKVPFSEAG
jgi:2'-5' RNA ligase